MSSSAEHDFYNMMDKFLSEYESEVNSLEMGFSASDSEYHLIEVSQEQKEQLELLSKLPEWILSILRYIAKD